jgi:N-acetylglutamate synthase-like GNAT family acetyltransferase
MDIRVRRPEDLGPVRTLLEAADLPTDGLELTTGWVAEEEGRVVGHLAMEGTGEAVVLRSMVVAPAARGLGLARRLLDVAEAEAGGRTLLLKTRTVGPWVERRGYTLAGPDQVPASVRGTTEFQGALCSCCPAYIKGAGSPG